VALACGFAWTLVTGEGAGLGAAVLSGLRFGAAAFVSWALGRELLPDDQAAAFVAMALGLPACLLVPDFGLAVGFATMALARVVNRSTGLAARVGDSVMVTALIVWALYATESPWLGAVGALAFLLDATLRRPLRRQWLFALVCLAALVAYVVNKGVASLVISAPVTVVDWLALPALVVLALQALRMREVSSGGDIGAEQLDLNRVRGGMAIGALAMLQELGNPQDSVLLIATIGGIALTVVIRSVLRTPAA
jgi:hypothetical protein